MTSESQFPGAGPSSGSRPKSSPESGLKVAIKKNKGRKLKSSCFVKCPTACTRRLDDEAVRNGH